MFRLSLSIAVAAFALRAVAAGAFPGADESFATRYPSATNLVACGTCHVSFDPVTDGDASLNPYGSDVLANLVGFDFDGAMAAVEGLDSDLDGSANVDEIGTDSGFFPGWTCETYGAALSAPLDLADFVDPIDPGCTGGGTTTTTVTTVTTSTTVTTDTTSTTGTTTTTLPGEQACSQPVTSGPAPVATDCLFILQAAVGSQTCSPECICAPTGTVPAKATDALLCLKHSVGDTTIPLQCPCNGGSTTTTTTGEGTTTTTGGGETTTTTAGEGTTTTTAGEGTTTTTVGEGTTTTTVGEGTTTTTVVEVTTTTTSTTLPPT